MVGNDNGAGNLGPTAALMPVKAKWYNDGTQELLLEAGSDGLPVNEDYKEWIAGKLSNKHPRTVTIRKEQREQEAK